MIFAPPAPPKILASEVRVAVRSAAAGTPFLASVRLTMQPGWHTYWKNPGENGAPTVVKLTGPAGWTTTPLEWPAPRRIATEAGVTFGYEDTVEFLFKVTPGKTGGPLKATGEALVCLNTCLPAKILAARVVDVSARGADGPEAGRLANLAAALPDTVDAKTLTATRKDGTLVVTGLPKGTVFDFDGLLDPTDVGKESGGARHFKLSAYGDVKADTIKLLVTAPGIGPRIFVVPVK